MFAALPEKFDHNMKDDEFSLFLNANGISYKVCKKLKGETIRMQLLAL